MQNYILTVSIAAYNVEKYIEQTLQSLNDPMFEGALEVLIIDDGSKDNTTAIANEFVSKNPNIFKLLSKSNGGWGSTVNYGIRNAKGRYFKQLDGDDLFDTSNLKELILFLNDSQADLVISPFHSFSDENGEIISENKYPQIEAINTPLKLEDIIQFYPYMEMHSSCFRTSLIKNIVLQENCFYTDVEFMVKAISNVETVSYFPKDIYCYRLDRTGQSMSWDGLIKHYKEHEKICFVLADFCNQLNVKEIIKQYLIQRTLYMIDNQFVIYFRIGKYIDNKNEIVSFDNKLKEKYNFLYKKVASKKIKLLRIIGYRGYKMCCRITK